MAMADGTVIHRDALPSSVAPLSSNSGSVIDLNKSLPEVTEELVGQVERRYFRALAAALQG